MLLSEAYRHSGNIRILLNNTKCLINAIDETKQRISNLKHDLNKNLIEKNKSAKYVVKEISASEKIYATAADIIEKTKSSVIKMDSLKTQIIALADSLTLK